VKSRFRFWQKHRLTEFSVSVNRNVPNKTWYPLYGFFMTVRKTGLPRDAPWDISKTKTTSSPESGRQQLASNNGLVVFRQAVCSCLSSGGGSEKTLGPTPPKARELETVICELCLRCLPLRQLPVPASSTDPLVTFVLPDSTESCRCPAEENSGGVFFWLKLGFYGFNSLSIYANILLIFWFYQL